MGNSSKFMFFRFSTRQKLIILTISLAQFSSFAAYAQLGPFFPREAEQRGVSLSIQGIIMGAFSFGQVFLSPFSGRLMRLLGCRTVFALGTSFTGLFTIAFGMLTFTPFEHGSPVLYITANIAMRLGASVGASAGLPACLTLIMKHFPDDRMMLMALSEAMIGIGLAAGPAIGGFLFELGGFVAPFLGIGGLSLVACAVGLLVLPPEEVDSKDNDLEQTPMTAFMLDPRSILITISAAVSGLSLAVFAPTLEPYVRKLHLEPYQVGLLFCMLTLGYMLTSPIIPKLITHVSDSKYIMLGGYCLATTAFLAVGPSPIFGTSPNDRYLWLIIVSVGLFGVGQAMTLIPTFHQFLDLLTKWDMPNNSLTFGTISGAWNAAISLGDLLGPVTAGFLDDHIGFQWTMSCCGLLDLLMIVSLALLVLYENLGTPRWKKQPEEKTKLLGEMAPISPSAPPKYS